MALSAFGRAFFGASAVLFGIIALMWHDPDTWQSLSAFWARPAGRVGGNCLMIAQILGGLGLMFPRTARQASIVLAAVYAVFSLVCIPGIVAAPKVFAQYDGFFEQFSLLCGVTAVYASCNPDAARSAAFARAARIGFGLCALSFTLAQAIYFHETAVLVPHWIAPNQNFWAVLTTVAFALASVAILINRQARLALRLLALMLGLFGVLVWVPLLIAHPQSHPNWSEFTLTLLITGAAWVVADMPQIALS